ncbi:unnamed protein product, partial [Adineta steineri]
MWSGRVSAVIANDETSKTNSLVSKLIHYTTKLTTDNDRRQSFLDISSDG